MENSNIRALNTEGRNIFGYAIVFNSPSRTLQDSQYSRPFQEIIKPEAISQEFINTQDVVAVWGHSDKNGILARWNKGKGTLKLKVDNVGLWFSFIAKDTPLGNEVLSMVTSGDITDTSFKFRTSKNNIKVMTQNNGEPDIHIITKIEQLLDISPVTIGAYAETSINARNDNEKKYISDNYSKLLVELNDNNKAIEELEKQLDEINKAEYQESQHKRYIEEMKNKYLPEIQTAEFKNRIQSICNDYMKNKNR